MAEFIRIEEKVVNVGEPVIFENNTKIEKVKAGDSIALPIVDNMFKYNTATVGIKIYKNKQLDDIVKHLNSVKNINKMFEAETVEIVEAEEIKPKKKSTRKKK